jgi:hypothetical protein
MRSMPVLDGHESAALEVAAASAGGLSGFLHRAGAFFLHEFREMLPPNVRAKAFWLSYPSVSAIRTIGRSRRPGSLPTLRWRSESRANPSLKLVLIPGRLWVIPDRKSDVSCLE